MKLHELLAVEGKLEDQSNKCRAELKDTFEKRRHLFEEKRVTFQPNGEGQSPQVEAQSEINTTVVDELKWINDHLTKSYDASYRVALANTKAFADIVLEDGTILAKNVPATALLELEKRVNDLQSLITAIPTLDPAKGFKPDTDKGAGIYKAREVNKTRTQKVKEGIVLYPATAEHPAQTQLIDKDIAVGRIQELEWSSLITPATKADMLDRVERLGRAVKAARSRANEVEVDKTAEIAAPLLKFVLGN